MPRRFLRIEPLLINSRTEGRVGLLAFQLAQDNLHSLAGVLVLLADLVVLVVHLVLKKLRCSAPWSAPLAPVND